jgi:uncharacterized protein (DUF1778 family)
MEYILFVPTTTIHFPPEVLKRVDAAAQRRGISRNRFVVQACEQAAARDSGRWPEGFFELKLSSDDRALLEEASRELEQVVLRNRANRGALLL